MLEKEACQMTNRTGPTPSPSGPQRGCGSGGGPHGREGIHPLQKQVGLSLYTVCACRAALQRAALPAQLPPYGVDVRVFLPGLLVTNHQSLVTNHRPSNRHSQPFKNRLNPFNYKRVQFWNRHSKRQLRPIPQTRASGATQARSENRRRDPSAI